MEFRQYLNEGSEGEKDVKKTLGRIPAKHRALVKDYKFVFQPTNCLRGDNKHIGLIDEKNKTITIAAPWNYGREYTLLHEVGHAVWKYVLDDDKRAEWKKLLGPVKKRNKRDLDQNDEEIFCMAYAQAYAKNGLEKYDHDELVDFVRGL
jgi:hypothetical protein